jgi:transposase-like protein
MQGTTGRRKEQLVSLALHGLVVLSVLGLALLGQAPAEAAGWIIKPTVYAERWERKEQRGSGNWPRSLLAWLNAVGSYLVQSWQPVLLRSVLLWALWAGSGVRAGGWVGLVPWLSWVWRGLAVGWPGLRRSVVWGGIEQALWQGQRLLLVGGAGLALGRWLQGTEAPGWPLGLGCVVCEREEPWVQVERQADGSYQATLCGHFTLAVAGDHPFRLRLLIVFLNLLDASTATRGSRRTRDGRTPLVRQQQMAEWFDVPQPHISLWLRRWLAGDWASLLSLLSSEVLTGELVERIVTVFATFPTWGYERVYHHLRQQGVAVTQAQVQQAAEQSGWQRLRQTLVERYDLSDTALRLRDGWLVAQLTAQVQALLAQMEANQALPQEQRLDINDLLTLTTAAGAPPPTSHKTLPWLLRVEQLVFGQWQTLDDDQVRCPACGSQEIGRKSATPRHKRYYDAQGQLQTVAVYRYYCRNRQCQQRSFTHLPPGLLPYSRYRSELHLLAVQMYTWGYSTYRRTGTALGVASLTAWRWVQAWGHDLLPVAALFGLVRSSGVVGVDEKYVLVPKNNKPDSAMRRWMYVYFAVDVWTYDLLHIAIYPQNNQASATAFLLALRTKGYHPDVIVTDLRQDYGPVIARVFPQATHHLCIFHALQDVQKHVKEVYGPNYAQSHPEADALKQQIYRIFDADTLTQATQCYDAVLALRLDYVQAVPEASAIFDFLQRHWPKLANSIGSDTIPATNNTVELVIRRFHQHYQSFCGFESIEHAHAYLAVFEKVYRFTPFSSDAQPRIRNHCPLQLAGYDVSRLPMASLCAGLSILWPLQPSDTSHVPNL